MIRRTSQRGQHSKNRSDGVADAAQMVGSNGGFGFDLPEPQVKRLKLQLFAVKPISYGLNLIIAHSRFVT